LGISEFLFGVSWSDWWSDADKLDGYLAIIFWVGLLEGFLGHFYVSGVSFLILVAREIFSFTLRFWKRVAESRLSNDPLIQSYAGPIWSILTYLLAILFLFGLFGFLRMIKGIAYLLIRRK